jgi:phytanoyl-CoA hydroxylase
MLSHLEKEQFIRDGFLVVKGFYSPDEVTAMNQAFMDENKDGPVPGLSDTVKAISPDDPLARYPRMMHPHRHPDKEVGRIALEFMLNARLEPVLRDLFEDEPIGAQTMFYFKPPGARGQALHQDNFYLRVKPGTCMAAWLALDVTDAANGGMMVVPGSHKTAVVCPEEADLTQSFSQHYVAVPDGMEAVHIEMQPGDLLFFNGGLIHGSPPNSSQDRFRRSLIAHYIPAASEEVSIWYRPLMRFNQDLVQKGFTDDGGPCGVVVAAPH